MIYYCVLPRHAANTVWGHLQEYYYAQWCLSSDSISFLVGDSDTHDTYTTHNNLCN